MKERAPYWSKLLGFHMNLGVKQQKFDTLIQQVC